VVEARRAYDDDEDSLVVDSVSDSSRGDVDVRQRFDGRGKHFVVCVDFNEAGG
jgi:hypothetical protein